MGERKIFVLPDLGEGLPDAEIVEWKVAAGDLIRLDAPLVAMETAKAVVDVPAPYSGRVTRLYGQAGDVIGTGQPLAEFELDEGPQRAAAQDTGHTHAPHPSMQTPANATPAPDNATTASASPSGSTEPDAGSVVGAVVAGHQVMQEAPVEMGGVRAMPAVRALARKLGVDLRRVRGTGIQGSVTREDVQRAAAAPQVLPAAAPAPAPSVVNATPAATPPPVSGSHTEPLRGVRRNMARTMREAHATVVPATLMDDADLHRWPERTDLTVRLIRALVAASAVEPALNAWYDDQAGTRTLHGSVHVGVAVDSPEGLFVVALQDAQHLTAAAARAALNRLRTQVRDRSIPAADLGGHTLTLSNFGVYAGRYATPVVVPPCVCIVAAGRTRYDAVPVLGGFAAHRMLPLSLTFDHRACTGGEAARFLKALIDDLERAD